MSDERTAQEMRGIHEGETGKEMRQRKRKQEGVAKGLKGGKGTGEER